MKIEKAVISSLWCTVKTKNKAIIIVMAVIMWCNVKKGGHYSITAIITEVTAISEVWCTVKKEAVIIAVVAIFSV